MQNPSPLFKITLGLMLLVASTATTIHAATITQLNRMLKVTALRTGNFDKTKALSPLLDITNDKFWIKTIGVEAEKIGFFNGKKIVWKHVYPERKELSLSYSGLNSKQLTMVLEALEDSPITNIDLSDNQNLNSVSPDVFTADKFKNVTSLNVKNCNLTAQQLAKIFEALKHSPISQLIIDYNKNLGNVDANLLASAFTCFEKLTVLTLMECNLTTPQLTSILPALQNLPLTELFLYYDKNLGNVNAVLLATTLKSLKKLTRLNLIGCNLTKNQLSSILPELQKLPLTQLALLTKRELEGLDKNTTDTQSQQILSMHKDIQEAIQARWK